MAKIVTEKEADKIAGEGGPFIRMSDGDVIEGVFYGDPCVVRMHWTGKDSFVCSETPECAHCNANYPARARFAYIFVWKKGESFSVGILELSRKSYNRYSKARSKHGKDCIMEVERDGAGMDTVYSYAYKANLSEDQKAKIGALEIPKLEKIYAERQVSIKKG